MHLQSQRFRRGHVSFFNFPNPVTSERVLGRFLLDAIRTGNTVEAIKLLAQDADFTRTDQYQRNALMLAAKRSCGLPLVALLLEKIHGKRLDPIIDAQDHFGRTALMIAAVHGNVDSINLLIEHKARTDVRDWLGKTAFDLARDCSFPRIAELLKAA